MLLLAHREELLTHSRDKFRLVWPGVEIGICKAEQNDIYRQVVCGSVQTCCRARRLEELKKQDFQILMVDEAHHATADSYQAIIEELGFGPGSSKLLLGVSATIDRQGLGATFDKIVFARSVGTMIKAGYLSPIVARRILTNLTLEKIRIQNGDFAVTDLAEAINTPERNRFIVQKFKEYASDRKAIVFGCDVAHCHDLASAFKEAGFRAEAVWGDMDKEARIRALDDLKNGDIQIAISCGILTEGYDETSISCVVMARPTRSQTLYVQCIGRGLRKHPGKENCLILDFTDRGHSLDSAMKLSTLIPEAMHLEEVEGEEKEDEEGGEELDRTPKIGAVETSDRAFDILGQARFMWVQIPGGEWSLMDDEKREIVMSPVENGNYTARLYFPEGTSRLIVSSALPLDYAMGICEDYARRNLKIAFADLSKQWTIAHCAPTPGQRAYLEKEGAFVEGMSKGQAAVAIRRIVATKNQRRRMMASEPLSLKQSYFLESKGVDVRGMNKMQGMREIARIKEREKAYG